MPEYAMLNDVSRCMGCRGCQVACKSWNNLPAENTIQNGSYQNPADLSENTWCLVRFNEVSDGNGNVKWLFRKNHCFHCTNAACIDVCPAPGAIYKTEEGAVVIDHDKCIGCKYCINVCPFEVPRFNPKTGKVYKCTLCIDRLRGDMIPACAKTCTSGAVLFGERKDILDTAKKRVKELGGNAVLYGDKYLGGTHVMYVLPESPALYAGLPVNPVFPVSVFIWRKIVTPLTLGGFLGAIGLAWMYYICRGPNRPKNGGDE